MNPPEILALLAEEALGVFVLLGAVVYLAVWWFRQGQPKVDPWENEPTATPATSEGAANESPLCIRCLTPHAEAAYFCPQCGHAVGPYNNYMPFLQIFSEGEVMRTATDGSRRMTLFTMTGYGLLALATFSVFAPFVWIVLVRRYLDERRQLAQRPMSPP